MPRDYRRPLLRQDDTTVNFLVQGRKALEMSLRACGKRLQLTKPVENGARAVNGDPGLIAACSLAMRRQDSDACSVFRM
jgi:hypothetical protein